MRLSRACDAIFSNNLAILQSLLYEVKRYSNFKYLKFIFK